MTRKEIREFGQQVVDRILHKKEQHNTIVVKGYIARDLLNNAIYFYKHKPVKGSHEWIGEVSSITNLHSYDFPQVKWDDDKPTPCEVTIKIEK